MKVKKILLIHGPNLNLLGTREPDIYGKESQDQLFELIKSSFLEIEFIFFQSNHEGLIIDKIHAKRDWADAMIINAGALSHYSYAIRDAITSINIPTIEVHLSDINNREDFRKKLVLSDVCIDAIIGQGKQGYLDAINKLKGLS
jgi:3-dehydroquinate dehydratase-2